MDLHDFSDCYLINSLPSSYKGNSKYFEVRRYLSVDGRMFRYQKYPGGVNKGWGVNKRQYDIYNINNIYKT